MIVQPILADYRIYFFNKLAKKFNTVVYCDSANKSSGHGAFMQPLFEMKSTKSVFIKKDGVYFQFGLFFGFLKYFPDVVFITAHPKNVSFWFVLILSKIFGTKTLVHGQGFYNKPNPHIIIRICYKLIILFSDRYVCYTDSSLASLRCLGPKYVKKLVVADNTIFNPYEISHRNINSEVNGVLYVGRFREGSNFSDLADAITKLNDFKLNEDRIILHAVGSGELFEYFKAKYEKYDCIVFYGAIYDQKIVSDISKKCFVGCYPGYAGLSVVHYLSLSLPTIVNSDMESHMGPEPSYIINGVNGYLFEEYSSNALYNIIKYVLSIKDKMEYLSICKNAYDTYSELISPDFSDKIESIIEDII